MQKKKIKILIADDNPNIRQTLTDILTEKGYSIETVKDGYELLAYIKERSPNIIILDLVMPTKSGTEVFTSIKNISPYTRIIIYTSFQKYEHSMYAEVADKWLLKSDNPEKLLETIEELSR